MSFEEKLSRQSEKDFKGDFKAGQNFVNRKFVVYKLEKEQRQLQVEFRQ